MSTPLYLTNGALGELLPGDKEATLKWVNAFREEFGLPTLDDLPQGIIGNGGNTCLMGTAMPGIRFSMTGLASTSGSSYDVPVPDFARRVEAAFEGGGLPEHQVRDKDVPTHVQESFHASSRLAQKITEERIKRFQSRALVARDENLPEFGELFEEVYA